MRYIKKLLLYTRPSNNFKNFYLEKNYTLDEYENLFKKNLFKILFENSGIVI